jgi:hypothetical protein
MSGARGAEGIEMTADRVIKRSLSQMPSGVERSRTYDALAI